MATARAELVEARAASEVAAREAARLRDMRRENADLVSEQDLDTVEGRASQAAARLDAAEARLAAAEANLRFARANLENTVIRAPFSGTVLRKEAFLAESALIALVGGVIGGLIALPVNGMVTSTTNWASFSEIAFSFRITPGLLLSGLVFALVMGLVGGFFPARRAARLPVVQALR